MDTIIYFLDENYAIVVFISFLALVKNEFDLVMGRAQYYLLKVLVFAVFGAIFLLRHHGISSFSMLAIVSMGIYGIASLLLDFILPFLPWVDFEQNQIDGNRNEKDGE